MNGLKGLLQKRRFSFAGTWHSKTYCCYYHAPTLVIVSNEPTQWWAGMDCACAIENMFLAAQSLGIGSCWINQLGDDM